MRRLSLPQFSRASPALHLSLTHGGGLDRGGYSSAMPDLGDPSGWMPADPAPMELSLSQRFELEAHSRLIDDLTDVETLRSIAKLILQSWYSQKAATAWVMRQGLRR